MSNDSEFDNWNWSDSPISGEVTNESWFSSSLDSVLGVVKDVADAKRYWEGDYGQSPYDTMKGGGYSQDRTIGTVEHEQNLNSSASSSAWYSNPLNVAAAVAAAGLLFLVVSK
jgi:hypothetical protein